LIRNGPAVFETLASTTAGPVRKYDHIFDGLAKLHSYSIKADQSVEFSSRFLRSSWYQKVVEQKEDLPPSITTGPVIPAFNLMQKVVAALTS
jgi:carotenoid cleavage dioxygenase-like enzyme